jgi:formate--tetrahydrofolate ligase
LAAAVAEAAGEPVSFTHLYDLSWPIRKKIETIATRMYGAGGVSFEPKAERQLDIAEALGFGALPVCMAKTPLSLSHDPALKGRPTGFTVPVKELRILAGAGFVTAVCSGIQLMPGLPRRPAGERIDLDTETGQITGLS